MTGRAWRRIAGLATLIYLAGVVMPSIALACGGDPISAYCFEEIAELVAAAPSTAHARAHTHVHSDGTVHVHVHGGPADAAPHIVAGHAADHGGASGHSHSHDGGDCCGAYGFSAVLPQLIPSITRPSAHEVRRPILTDDLAGRSPDRIDRPPISS